MVITYSLRCKRKMKLTWVSAEDDDCDPKSKPDMVNYCQVSCAGQCVVSQWSQWSKCQVYYTSNV